MDGDVLGMLSRLQAQAYTAVLKCITRQEFDWVRINVWMALYRALWGQPQPSPRPLVRCACTGRDRYPASEASTGTCHVACTRSQLLVFGKPHTNVRRCFIFVHGQLAGLAWRCALQRRLSAL